MFTEINIWSITFKITFLLPNKKQFLFLQQYFDTSILEKLASLFK